MTILLAQQVEALHKLVLTERPFDHPGKSLPFIQQLNVSQAHIGYRIPLRTVRGKVIPLCNFRNEKGYNT